MAVCPSVQQSVPIEIALMQYTNKEVPPNWQHVEPVSVPFPWSIKGVS